jgi:hypothetical protein
LAAASFAAALSAAALAAAFSAASRRAFSAASLRAFSTTTSLMTIGFGLAAFFGAGAV